MQPVAMQPSSGPMIGCIDDFREVAMHFCRQFFLTTEIWPHRFNAAGIMLQPVRNSVIERMIVENRLKVHEDY